MTSIQPSRSLCLGEILKRNNDAIDKIQEGKLTAGINGLRDVLRTLQSELAVDLPSPANDASSTTRTTTTTKHNTTILLSSVTLTQMATSHQPTSLPDDAFPMYNRAFKCMITTAERPRHEPDTTTFLKVIVYNLGLTMHQHGLLHGSGVYLRKALRLYTMAISLLPDLALLKSDCHLFMLTMALHNNQGHIHCCLNELSQAQDCFFHIQRAMYNADQSTILVMDETDYEFCLRYYTSKLFLLCFNIMDSPNSIAPAA